METFIRGMAILDLNENVKEKSNQDKSVCKTMELTLWAAGGWEGGVRVTTEK